jgi:HK97 family phage portal protein
MGVLGNLLMTAENPTVSDLRDERQWQPLGFVSQITSSGIRVNPVNALTLSAYFDGIRIISEDIAKLPLITFRKLERGKEPAPEHPVYPLLKRSPNENMASMSFREAMTANAISWGGGFALIERNGRGMPQRLDIVHPSRVKVEIDDRGRTFYEVGLNRNKTSIETIIVRQANIFHLHGVSEDGINGYSVARLGAESLGRAIAQDRFSASFFRSGSSPKGAIKFAKKFRDAEELERLRTQWQETYAGESGWHKPIILEQGAEWQQITIPPEDAQMIESQNFSVNDVARWLRIAPHKLAQMSEATFSNIEQQNLDHINDTLMPWINRWEEEIERKLFIGEEDEFFARHILTELLRGDSAARSKFSREMFNIGALSQNDIREGMDMNPIEDGDVYYIQGQMVRTEDAAKGDTIAMNDPPAGQVDGFDNEPNDTSEPRQEYFDLIKQALAGCDKKERLATNNAIKKHGEVAKGFDEWWSGFRELHSKYVFDAVAPVAKTIGDLVKKFAPLAWIKEFSIVYVETAPKNRDEVIRMLVKRIQGRSEQ